MGKNCIWIRFHLSVCMCILFLFINWTTIYSQCDADQWIQSELKKKQTICSIIYEDCHNCLECWQSHIRHLFLTIYHWFNLHESVFCSIMIRDAGQMHPFTFRCIFFYLSQNFWWIRRGEVIASVCFFSFRPFRAGMVVVCRVNEWFDWNSLLHIYSQ